MNGYTGLKRYSDLKKRNTLQTRYLDLYENVWDHGDNIH